MVEVVKGGCGYLGLCFWSILAASQEFSLFSSSPTILLACFSFFTSAFLPSICERLDSNCWLLAAFCPLRMASIDQYSCGTNLSISLSRSTMRRTATDWTLPAESPLFTLNQSSGDSL